MPSHTTAWHEDGRLLCLLSVTDLLLRETDKERHSTQQICSSQEFNERTKVRTKGPPTMSYNTEIFVSDYCAILTSQKFSKDGMFLKDVCTVFNFFPHLNVLLTVPYDVNYLPDTNLMHKTSFIHIMLHSSTCFKQ